MKTWQRGRSKRPCGRWQGRGTALLGIGALVLAGLAASPVSAESVTLDPVKDNTIFGENSDRSNGHGEYIFAGSTSFGGIRRALIQFDVACRVPPTATITSATLALTMTKTIVGETPVSLYRVDGDWGEADSDASFEEGRGDVARTGDATWLHRFYNTVFWTNPGGDFDISPSATTPVDQTGPYVWTSPEMAADVQGWLQTPSSNHGWILIGDEGEFSSAKRYASREYTLDPSARPSLTITYTVASAPAGTVPASLPGTPLRIVKGVGGTLVLTWGPSCLCTDHDYEVYEGSLGSFFSHAPVLCTTSGATTATITPALGRRYYLVVPHNGTSEGSYGLRSNLVERPQGAPACRAQEIGPCQ